MRHAIRPRLPRHPAWGGGLLAALAVLLAPACDKMPLMAPSNTTITLYASNTVVGLNGSVDVTATVIESAGTPVQNGTVVSFTTTLGTLDPVDARTENGKATVRFLSGTKSGTAEIRATSGGNSTKDATKISVGAAAVGRVELLANPTSLPASGGVVQLTAIVSDGSGNRLGGVPVSFATDAGVLAQTSVSSDSSGEARTTLTTTAKASVVASVVGGTSGTVKSESLSIPVRTGPSISLTVPSSTLVPGVSAAFSVQITAGSAAVRTASIDFGDGMSQALSTAGSSTASHVYGRSGTFLVTASATDTAGETTTSTGSVNVQAIVVSVTLTVPVLVTTIAPADFSAAVTTTPTGAVVDRYEWDFGDGTAMRTTSGNTTSHLYALGGGRRYFVTVRVYTTSGASGSAVKEIVVN